MLTILSVKTEGYCSRGGLRDALRSAEAVGLFSAQEPLAQSVDERTVVWRQVAHEAVDGFDDHAPLRKSGDSAEGVEPDFHLHRQAYAELRIVFDAFAGSGSRGRTAGASTTRTVYASVGHGRAPQRGTVEMRTLRDASDSWPQQ